MDVKRLIAHWQDEGESAYLYKILASLEETDRKKRIFNQLAEVELRHQRTFLEMIENRGGSVGEWKPGIRTRFLGWLAKHGNASTVLSLRISDEAREVRGYLGESKSTTEDDIVNNQRGIAREEARHAEVLSELAGQGRGNEPWHQNSSGDFLRNVIYGFNDGLTANFGLVMGVIGAEAAASSVLIAGLSGLVADALSMGGSGFLAAKSEQEVWQNEIAMEREEIELMPEVEMQELALLYEAKGMPREAAQEAAAQVMSDPETAVQEKAREELGISGDITPPFREALVTGIATALGAFIPVVPFIFGSTAIIIWISFAISMLSHFVVGAARSIFTGRGIIRSGFDMFVVGLGVAGVGYLVGMLITGHLHL